MTPRLLVACEFSGAVREAFRARGVDAVSCDLLPAEDGSEHHYQGDVRDIIGDGWDMMIGFPPCTYLAVSGIHWTVRGKRSWQLTNDALDFVRFLMDAPVPRIAIENPIGLISTYIREPDQIIQPWMFGHGETKATCLWLKGLPKLKPTHIVEGREQRIWKEPPGETRWMERSRTYAGIAAAMAEQWTDAAPQPYQARLFEHITYPIPGESR